MPITLGAYKKFINMLVLCLVCYNLGKPTPKT